MKKNANIKPNSVKIETEYLSKDILEEHFISEFSQCLNLQKILGISHVEARDRFVTAPSRWQKLYSIVLFTISTLFYFLCSYKYAENYDYIHMTILLSINLSILALFYFLVLFNARFYNNDGNMRFYVQMQKIDRMMRIEHNQSVYTMMRWLNLTNFAIFFVGFFILFVGASLGEGLSVMYMGFIIPFITCPLEVGYGSNLIMHFFIRVRFINAILVNYIEGKDSVKTPKSIFGGPTNSKMRYLAAQAHEFETSETDLYLREILECYQRFQDFYRIPIGYCLGHIFIFILIGCQFVYFGLSKNELLVRDLTAVISNILFGLIHAIALCLRCPLRFKAKRMLRLLDQTPLQFSIYDMWEVDNKFIISFLKNVNNIIFTVLQLNFLR